MHGQAVFQTVHAAGVFRDIAADRAGDLRRRVRGVVQAVGSGRLGNRQVAYAGLDAGEAADRIDLEDALEARHHQQDAFLQRQGAAGKPGACATGYHRHA
ncbi:hypothetical protein D3C76_1074140 [compost metagenome]